MVRECQSIFKFDIYGTAAEAKKKLQDAEKIVINSVTNLAKTCLSKNQKYCDPDFGPTTKDPTGMNCIAKDGKIPASLKDLSKAKWRWARPGYEGVEKVGNEPLYCEDAKVFGDGFNANDVEQGILGDCWFLSALSLLASQPVYLENIIYLNEDKEIAKLWVKVGVWVCRFIKDSYYYYVVIDDRIVVYDTDGSLRNKPLFASCKRGNIIWMCLIEKAYAKLNHSYISLIGGLTHYALRDLTGLCPVVLQHHFTKKSIKETLKQLEFNKDNSLWEFVKEQCSRGGLLCCSIPIKPKCCFNCIPNWFNHKVKSHGLIPKHTYSILGTLEINTCCCFKKRFIVLRNPWGKDSWTGDWNRKSLKFKFYHKDIEKSWKNRLIIRNSCVNHKDYGRDAREELLFNNNNNKDNNEKSKEDGIFIMKYEDWKNYYNNIGMVIKFPDNWSGYRIRGEWDGSKNYPNHSIEIYEDNSSIFIEISQPENRGENNNNNNNVEAFAIGFSLKPNPLHKLPIFTVGGGSLSGILNKGKYSIIAKTYDENKKGKYILSFYSDKKVYMSNGLIICEEEERMEGGVVKEDVYERRCLFMKKKKGTVIKNAYKTSIVV